MEYAGYGLYTDENPNEYKIKNDAKSLMGYVINQLNFSIDKIILCG
jgi:hypothetical protein